ncbi:RNase H family protein [Afipia broomeae]|uniref:RNase H type-1 domain-containing protein n=1 Tax=Afipia broomeae ATCC 49717 TaxID=883078 RepID=K8NVC4_9BRAD|nr:RNase H family protein [Afipia broomeae]EKS34242.1 hypothetical protein HMPREF9695_04152 [Afipia broomeae ATCC 49717]
MTRTIWPKQLPRLSRGHFVGWILSTDRPSLSECPSACTWLIHPLDDSTEPHADVKISQGNYSDEKRANLAGAIGAVEDLEPESSIILFTRETYVSDGLILVGEWRDNGWKNAKGELIKNDRLWARLLEVIEERELDVTARHWQADEYRATHIKLKKLAQAALNKRGRSS